MTSLPNSTFAPITVGIDVAKDTIEVAIGLNTPTLSLSNDAGGFDALLKHLAAHQVALVVMEDLSAYHFCRMSIPAATPIFALPTCRRKFWLVPHWLTLIPCNVNEFAP